MTDPHPLVDNERLTAAIELIGRCAANALELGWTDDTGPRPGEWFASARYRGARVTVEDQEGPEAAAEALALKLVAGGRCVMCGRTTTASSIDPDDGTPLVMFVGGHPELDEEVIEYRPIDELRRTLCITYRDGSHWLRGCDGGHGTPPRKLNKYQRRRQDAAKALRR